jgi:hypothetical protein
MFIKICFICKFNLFKKNIANKVLKAATTFEITNPARRKRDINCNSSQSDFDAVCNRSDFTQCRDEGLDTFLTSYITKSVRYMFILELIFI